MCDRGGVGAERLLSWKRVLHSAFDRCADKLGWVWSPTETRRETSKSSKDKRAGGIRRQFAKRRGSCQAKTLFEGMGGCPRSH
jgi:hypothetical protein